MTFGFSWTVILDSERRRLSLALSTKCWFRLSESRVSVTCSCSWWRQRLWQTKNRKKWFLRLDLRVYVVICLLIGWIFLVVVGFLCYSDFCEVYLHPVTITITDLLLILHISSLQSDKFNVIFRQYLNIACIYMLLVSIKFSITLVLNCDVM